MDIISGDFRGRPARPPRSLVVVRALHRAVYDQFASLHDFAANHHLVKDLVDFVEVEDEVQLAYTPKVLIQHLHEQVDEFKHRKLAIFGVDAQSEEKPGIAAVNNFMVPILRTRTNERHFG